MTIVLSDFIKAALEKAGIDTEAYKCSIFAFDSDNFPNQKVISYDIETPEIIYDVIREPNFKVIQAALGSVDAGSYTISWYGARSEGKTFTPRLLVKKKAQPKKKEVAAGDNPGATPAPPPVEVEETKEDGAAGVDIPEEKEIRPRPIKAKKKKRGDQ